MTKFLYFLIATALIILVVAIADRRTELLDAAASDYEECMEERAGMTPTAFYMQFGYYPECF